MTICVAVKVHDCLAVAADSASSISFYGPGGAQGVHRVYFNGNKIFNLFKGQPICAFTAGLGNIGPLSISTVAKDLRLSFLSTDPALRLDPAAYTMESVAERAQVFINDQFAGCGLVGAPIPDLQFWVGGYPKPEGQPELWELKFTQGKCDAPVLKLGPDVCGVEMGGQPEALQRLVLGSSPKLYQQLVAAGVDPNIVSEAFQTVAQDPEFQVFEPAMPAQDAIDLATFLAETAEGFVNFQPGPDTVGGFTDVAAITKHEGFKWVRRKHYYPAELNPLETDHA